MKVELLVTLKTANGAMISPGTVFTDVAGPIPEFIMKRVARGQAKVLDATPSSPPKADVEEKAEPKLPGAVSKLLGKKDKKRSEDKKDNGD